jgi:hypothetical protein
VQDNERERERERKRGRERILLGLFIKKRKATSMKNFNLIILE